MRPSLELIIEIITKLKGLDNLVESFADQNDPYALLRKLPIGNGKSIASSKEVDDLISLVAEDLQKNDKSLAIRFSTDELFDLLRGRAFGQALAENDSDDDISSIAKTVLRSVKEFIMRDHDRALLREYYFACTLFDNTTTSPFSIGPVRFEPRTNWLARKAADGTITHTTQQRIERAWQVEKLEDREFSLESSNEENILNHIWKFPFMCSVETKGYAPRIGQDKAMQAARIAMTSIALLWPNPRPSKTLLEHFKFSFDFDRTLGLRVTNISCELGKLSFDFTNRRMPDGLRFENCTWEELFKIKEAHFKVIGKVLEFYLDFQKQSAQPKMMKALLHALLLFHEGCLNQSSLLSTVNFAASLDALAAGQKGNGILKLINARLGKDRNDQLFSDRSTPKQVVDKIYKYARSSTLHGTNDNLGYDWSDTRDHAEQLAWFCLNACLQWTSDNPAEDSPNHLLT